MNRVIGSVSSIVVGPYVVKPCKFCVRARVDTLRIYLQTDTRIHTYMHAYMHTCICAYIHAYIHAYMHTCIHAYMLTCIHAYMQAITRINKGIHAYVCI